MKSCALLLLAFLVPGFCLGQPSIRLTGIISIGGKPSAVIEVQDARPPFGRQSAIQILRAGESESKLEVISIDLAQATAEVRFHGTNLVLALPADEKTRGLNVQLISVPLSAALKFYGELTGLTLLRHPELTEQKLSITSAANERPALAAVFAAALTNAGVVSIPDGDKFLRVLPAVLAEKIQRIEIPSRGTNEPGLAEKLPAGAIDFIAAKFEQAAWIQAELINRKLEPYELSRSLKDIALRTQQPLTRAEIIYAIDVQLAWRGFKMIAVDDKLARIVPLESNP